ncbi:glycosyltransferase family 9 protein [Candidatus Poribacteria bacterium]|nr:glycosyltransferase family 9 protein [Candidatus Poribacteria bacterium]
MAQTTLIKHAEKILILEFGGIGDVVMAIPTLRAIRGSYPDAHITIALVPRSVELLSGLAELDGQKPFELIAFPSLTMTRGVLKLLWQLRRRNYDLVVDLSAVESAKAGIKRRVFLALLGGKKKIGRDTDGRASYLSYGTDELLLDDDHEVEKKFKVAHALTEVTTQPGTILPLSNANEKQATDLLNSHHIQEDTDILVGFVPGGSSQIKQWEPEKFATLAQRLIKRLQAKVVIVGSPGDANIIQQITQDLDSRHYVEAVGLSLLDLAALIQKMDAVVSNNTGALHISAAVDVPSVSLFYQTNVHRYRPYIDSNRTKLLKKPAAVCPYIHFRSENDACLRESCKSHECMGYTVNEVETAVIQLLERLSPKWNLNTNLRLKK